MTGDEIQKRIQFLLRQQQEAMATELGISVEELMEQAAKAFQDVQTAIKDTDVLFEKVFLKNEPPAP